MQLEQDVFFSARSLFYIINYARLAFPVSSTGRCEATAPGEAYPCSPPERAQEQCQICHHGNRELCKRHLSLVLPCLQHHVFCSRTKGAISTKFPGSSSTMVERSRMVPCPLLCELLQHTNQYILLFLTHHYFHDLTFTS